MDQFTFSMPGRGASTVGTEHMARNGDELSRRISSTVKSTKAHLWALGAVGTRSPDHTVDVSPVVSLQLVVRGVARQQSVPGQRHLLFFSNPTWLIWVARGLSPKPGHQSPENVSEMHSN